MAYTDANAVTTTPSIGWKIASTGINAGGYGTTLAVAFKPTDSTQADDMLVAVQDDSANHYCRVRLNTTLSGAPTTSTIEIGARASPATEDFEQTAAVVTQDAWSIVVVRFTDASNWRVCVNSDTPEAFTPAGNTISGIDMFAVANLRGADYYPGVLAWAAVWHSNMADADMEDLAAGSVSPNDLSPDELLYFENNVAIEGENGSTVTTVGAGSITAEGTFPTGWPPAGGGGISGVEIIGHYYRHLLGG